METTKQKEYGALWSKTSKNGNAYMNGVIEIDGKKYPVVIFQNTHKFSENSPDFRILESVPAEPQPVTA